MKARRPVPPGRFGDAAVWVHWAILIGASTGLALGLSVIGAPAPFLLGPLIAAIALAAGRGATLRTPPRLFMAAQALVGGMIAMSTSASLWIAFAANWPVYLVLAATTLGVATLIGWAMTRRGWLTGTTAIWGLAPGASTAMILMSDAFGGDQRQVALMQYLRILAVALVAMALSQMAASAGAHVDGVGGGAFQVSDMRDFLLTLAFLTLAGWFGKVSRIPAGILLVPMLAGAALQTAGLLTLTLPPALLMVAYAVIGWHIGLQFTRQALRYSARAAPRMAGAILLLLASCGLVAWLTHRMTGVDLLSAYLATSPGGTDTILIIAASTPVDLPFILGAQLARFLLVLALGPLVARAAARNATETETPIP